MIPLVNPEDRILLKKLIPQQFTQTNGQTGFEIIRRDYERLKGCVETSERDGLVSADERKDITKDLNRVYSFFQDLSKRERKVFLEGDLRTQTDNSLRSDLDRLFYGFCEYLDSMNEILKRLRNSGHLSNDQFESLVNRFEGFRSLHRRVTLYLHDLYL